MTGKELSKEEKQEVVDDIGSILDRTHYFGFEAAHLLTKDEMHIMNTANSLIGYVIEKVAKRYKVKI